MNSVNWARVLAQIVYYFSAGLYVMDQHGAPTVSFAVPTGNFGDMLAGYYAWRMGLPISRLVLATNENDILARFFNTGIYELGEVVKTLSPSMDIQVASNFERYLYDRVGRDSLLLRGLLEGFQASGRLAVPEEAGAVEEVFVAGVGDTEQTLDTIRRYQRDYDYLLDPHTAVGVYVGEQQVREGEPMICLATAHPAKFNEAITRAVGRPARHEILDALADAETRCETLPCDEDALKAYIARNARRVRR